MTVSPDGIGLGGGNHPPPTGGLCARQTDRGEGYEHGPGRKSRLHEVGHLASIPSKESWSFVYLLVSGQDLSVLLCFAQWSVSKH